MAASRLPASSFLKQAQSVRTELFTYNLPEAHIASKPLQDRSSSKLLVVPRNKPPAHYSFSDLPSLLPRESLLVLNSTKVIPSRIPAVKSTGGRAEILLLEPLHGLAHVSLQSHTSGQLWRAFLGGRRIAEGELLSANNGDLTAEVVSRQKQSAILRLESRNISSLSSLLASVGQTPLPPYIKREAEASDVHDYQTVYARELGSVAAPTAGLHITDGVQRDLRSRGIRIREVVLHVGAGTFKPVESDHVGKHDMHEEAVAIDSSVVVDLIAHINSGAPLVAVGTTSVRTLESIYWFGVRLLREKEEPDGFFVNQWEPYERLDCSEALPRVDDALQAVLSWSTTQDNGRIYGRTKLIIVPGYPFRLVNAMITNFHQPRSTLLLLVSAFQGGSPEDLIRLYKEALKRKYRFLSYGDSSLYTDGTFKID